MLLGISLEEAIKTIGHDGITTDEEIWLVSGTDKPITHGTPPKDIVAIQKHKDPKSDKEHWTLFWKGVVLDPANIGKKLWPVSKYFEIDWT